MNLSILYESSPLILGHIFFAGVALLVGVLQLFRKKGSPSHKYLGYIWVCAMSLICISSFGIKTIMPNNSFWGFSPIHLLSVWVLYKLTLGIYYARTKQIAKHRKCMLYTYFGGLFIAGAFTLMPGRLLYKVLIAATIQ